MRFCYTINSNNSFSVPTAIIDKLKKITNGNGSTNIIKSNIRLTRAEIDGFESQYNVKLKFTDSIVTHARYLIAVAEMYETHSTEHLQSLGFDLYRF